MSNSLYPDQFCIQIRPDIFVGPDLDTSCLQMSSADDTNLFAIHKMHATIANRETPFQKICEICGILFFHYFTVKHVAARFHSRVIHNVTAINGSANIKVCDLEQIYLKYQTCASTARKLLYFTIRLCLMKHNC